MFTEVHLTLHHRMSGSRWLITPSWLSVSWRSFLYSSSAHSCHLFLISSGSVMSIPFLSFIVSIFAWNVPLVSLNFLKRTLDFSIYFFPLFLCNDHWGRLSYLSLLFFGSLHSSGYVFPFLICLLLLFYSELQLPPYWHQGLILWKTIFACTRMGGERDGLGTNSIIFCDTGVGELCLT